MTYAGVELGGTKCVVMLARGPAEVLARETIPTTSPDETLARIAAVLAPWDYEALGIASFGPLELDAASPRYGRILNTPKPGWVGADLMQALRPRAAVATAVDTDVNGAALAEMRWGCGRGLQDFAYITVGTGVGVGLIANGLPTRGLGHCELGHIRVPRLPGDDFAGSCPFHGDCVEGLAAGPSLIARVGAERSRALASDDPLWGSVTSALAQLCHAIVCAAAPRLIAIGGGVIDSHPHLLPKVQSLLVESLNGFIDVPDDYVRAPELGRDAGPLGAIAVAMTARP